MRYSTAAALVAAMTASQVVAGPLHRVKHAHLHDKKDLAGVDWSSVKYDFSGVDWSTVDYSNGNGPKPTAAPAAPAVNVATEDDDKPVTTSSNNNYNDDSDLVPLGLSNGRTSFEQATTSSGNEGDFYLGNIGEPYCSNVIKVGSTDGYDYTNNIINTSDNEMKIVVWNKAGNDSRVLSGGAFASRFACLTFILQPGQNQIIAAQSDSQIAFAEATDDLQPSGHFGTTFAECNMTPRGPACNVSAILNKKGNTYKMKITNAQNTCVSSNEENCWITETFTLLGADGKDKNGSCWIPGAKGNFETEMGGQQ